MLRALADRTSSFIGRKIIPSGGDRFRIGLSLRSFPYFHHAHNCGFPGKRKTERTIELALADFWLDRVTDAVEVGAVTPYYWPGRVKHVIDPADQSPHVTQQASLLEVDLTGRNVLSISTVEHIGEQRYGMNETATSMQGLEKLFRECARYLVTFPAGYNQILDEFVFAGGADKFGKVRYLVRNPDESWRPAPRSLAWRAYGGDGITWANCVVVIEKGGVL
ncbi:MAG: hypothetical protein KGZ91_07915 [Afipia sp.]|nr:hypothetical protein [Afipia sp.]